MAPASDGPAGAPTEAPPRRWTQRRTWVISGAAAATLLLVTLALTQGGKTDADSLLSHDRRPAPSFALPDLRAPAQTVQLERECPRW